MGNKAKANGTPNVGVPFDIEGTIGILRLLYGVVEYAGNNLLVCVEDTLEFHSGIHIIDAQSGDILYRFMARRYSIENGYIKIEIIKRDWGQDSDAVEIKSKLRMGDILKVDGKDLVIWDFKVVQDIICVRATTGRNYRYTNKMIFNSQHELLRKEPNGIENLRVRKDRITYNTNIINGTTTTSREIDKHTGKIIKDTRINTIKLIKDSIYDMFNSGPLGG